jgi:hypothetical protein
VRKFMYSAMLVAIAAALVVVGTTALAAKPKKNTFYDDAKHHMTLQTDDKGNIQSFNGGCTASAHSKYTFSYIWGIKVKKNGKFTASHQNSVNTRDGGTLTPTSKVTISGKFVSKKEAKGTFKLHHSGCKSIKFDAKP